MIYGVLLSLFRVPVKVSSFVIDESFSSFDKSSFLTINKNDELYDIKRVATIYTLRNDETFFKTLAGTLLFMCEISLN